MANPLPVPGQDNGTWAPLLNAFLGVSLNPADGTLLTSAVNQALGNNATPGTYGDATHVAVFTVNAQGIITGVSSVAITGSGIAALTGDVTASGSGSVVASLKSTGTAGTYGDATHVAQITTDAQGRVTSVTPVSITGVPPGGAAGGDLTGSFPNPTVAKINGSPLGTTTGALNGDVLQWNGSAWATSSVAPVLFVESTGGSIAVSGPQTALNIERAALTGDVTASQASSATTLVGTTNVNTVVGALGNVTNKLALAGGTMSGPIAMGSSKITGLANGTAAQDAAAFGQLPSTAAWTAYTPTFTSSGTAPSIGNGILQGFYWQYGKTLLFNIQVAWGSTTSVGTGIYSFGLPVSCGTSQIGQAYVYDKVNAGTFPGIALLTSNTTVQVTFFTGGGGAAYGGPNFNGSPAQVVISGAIQAS